MIFQVDVSFHFKKYTRNAASKMKCNMILSSLAFDLQAGDFLTSLLRLTSFYDSCHPEKNICLFCQALRRTSHS